MLFVLVNGDFLGLMDFWIMCEIWIEGFVSDFFDCIVGLYVFVQFEFVEVVGEIQYFVWCQLCYGQVEQFDVVVLYVEYVFYVFGVGEGWWVDEDQFVLVIVFL